LMRPLRSNWPAGVRFRTGRTGGRGLVDRSIHLC
jgi:hypothetical protein